MNVGRFFENKIKRQVRWNGRDLKFVRFVRDEYNQATKEVDFEYEVHGVFHEGGGYGGMLNIEMYASDAARTVSKMKPMILCLYADGCQVEKDDKVAIGSAEYFVVEKNDVSNFGVAFEISLEIDNGGR